LPDGGEVLEVAVGTNHKILAVPMAPKTNRTIRIFPVSRKQNAEILIMIHMQRIEITLEVILTPCLDS
jgi:hypothetical protein